MTGEDIYAADVAEEVVTRMDSFVQNSGLVVTPGHWKKMIIAVLQNYGCPLHAPGDDAPLPPVPEIRSEGGINLKGISNTMIRKVTTGGGDGE